MNRIKQKDKDAMLTSAAWIIGVIIRLAVLWGTFFLLRQTGLVIPQLSVIQLFLLLVVARCLTVPILKQQPD